MKGSKGDRYIIDSYGWIEYFSDGKLAGKYASYIERSTPELYFTPSIVFYEVYKKIRSLYPEEESIAAIMHIDSVTSVIDIDIKLSIKGAEINMNEKLPMADALIRGVGLHLDAKIITSDKHFKDLDNVIFIQ